MQKIAKKLKVLCDFLHQVCPIWRSCIEAFPIYLCTFVVQNTPTMIKKIKPYMMPIAITVGAIFYNFFDSLSFLTPYLIFTMLFLTYCTLKLNDIRLSKLHVWMISIQMLGSLAVYFILAPFNVILAQGAMICILAPTGTAAPVITGMLKGDVASVTAYSLLSNMSIALMAPVIFSFIGSYQSIPFIDSFSAIAQKVMLLLLTPFITAMLLRKVSPRFTSVMAGISGVSFYIWSLALCVVTGRTVGFILKQTNANHVIEIMVALIAFVVCVAQFLGGRKIGSLYDKTIVGGQGLGQKNTILAIWMAQTYLNPIASIAPGAYVLWQNIINSYQVWLKRKTL
jgi:bile acid:Na+ symporter, BASS family